MHWGSQMSPKSATSIVSKFFIINEQRSVMKKNSRGNERHSIWHSLFCAEKRKTSVMFHYVMSLCYHNASIDMIRQYL